MPITPDRHPAWASARVFRRASAALALMLVVSATGCLSSLNKHSVALSNAITPVLDQATQAYRDANTLHDQRTDFDAIQQFDQTSPVYNPRNVQPLLSEKDIQVRLAVLAAFQSYAQSLVAITSGTDSPELDAAAVSVGTNLTGLGNTVAPSIEGVLGIAAATPAASSTSTSTSTATPAISTTAQNGISTATNALAQFLINKKVKSQLPGIIETMDPSVQSLCELLEKDIDALHDIETKDNDYVINQETLFLRTATMDPELRRQQIMKLPALVRQQRAADENIQNLKASIVRLALTHHALAAEAQGNNPESLLARMAELQAVAANLGSFYSSLSAN